MAPLGARPRPRIHHGRAAEPCIELDHAQTARFRIWIRPRSQISPALERSGARSQIASDERAHCHHMPVVSDSDLHLIRVRTKSEAFLIVNSQF